MIYTLQDIKTKILPIIVAYGIKAVYVFGSYARGTATEESDIDLLIDTTGTSLTTMFRLGKLFDELQATLGKKIDLVTISALQQKHSMQSDVLFQENVMTDMVCLNDVA